MYGLVEDKGKWEIQAKTLFSIFVPSMPRKWNYVNINKIVFLFNVNFSTQRLVNFSQTNLMTKSEWFVFPCHKQTFTCLSNNDQLMSHPCLILGS